MASQGPNSPGTTGEITDGSVSWAPTDNVKTSNNVYVGTSYFLATNTNTLYVHNFGFTIPTGAAINGILAEIEERKIGTYTGVNDVSVKIRKADGTLGSTNRGKTTTEWSTTEAYVGYGSSSDLWGESWTDTDINDSDFGVSIKIHIPRSDKGGSGYGLIDHIRITVYYTEGSSSAIKTVNGLAKASVATADGLANASVKTWNGLA